MKRYLLATLVLCSIFAGALTISSGPLRRGDVASEPAWVVHLDVDVLRPTALGQYLLTEMEKPQAQAKLAAFQALVNFDLRTQLHGLTLYSLGAAPEDGVLLVYADFDPERLVTLAKAAKDSQNTPYKQNVIYNWLDDKKKPKNGVKPRTYAAIQGKCVIFGQREATVARAIDVITGASANLAAGNAFPAFGAAGNTSFLQAAAQKMDFLQGDPNAQVLRLSKQITLEVADSQQNLSAALTLQASDEEVANSIHSIINGLISLLKIQKEKPESVKLGQALTLQQDGALVHVNMSLPITDVIEMMKADAVRKAQKKAAAAERQ